MASRSLNEQGSQYFFDPADFSTFNFNDGNPAPGTGSLAFDYISRWVIKKIIFANGQQITYDYETNIPPANFSLYRSEAVTEFANGSTSTTGGFAQADALYSELGQLTAVIIPTILRPVSEFDQTPPAPGNGCSKSIKQIKSLRMPSAFAIVSTKNTCWPTSHRYPNWNRILIIAATITVIIANADLKRDRYTEL